MSARLDAARTAALARVRAQRSLPLVGGGHALVVVCMDGGRWMAGTDRALSTALGSCPGADNGRVARVGWEEIAGLTWNSDSGVVTVIGLLWSVPPRTVVHRFSVTPALGETLAGVARERISSTEIVRARLDHGQHGAVRVTGLCESFSSRASTAWLPTPPPLAPASGGVGALHRPWPAPRCRSRNPRSRAPGASSIARSNACFASFSRPTRRSMVAREACRRW